MANSSTTKEEQIAALTEPEAFEIERMRRAYQCYADDLDMLAFHIDHAHARVTSALSDVYSALHELQRLRAGVLVLEEIHEACDSPREVMSTDG